MIDVKHPVGFQQADGASAVLERQQPLVFLQGDAVFAFEPAPAVVLRAGRDLPCSEFRVRRVPVAPLQIEFIPVGDLPGALRRSPSCTKLRVFRPPLRVPCALALLLSCFHGSGGRRAKRARRLVGSRPRTASRLIDCWFAGGCGRGGFRRAMPATPLVPARGAPSRLRDGEPRCGDPSLDPRLHAVSGRDAAAVSAKAPAAPGFTGRGRRRPRKGRSIRSCRLCAL
jgi:hypothetical protein